MLEIAKLQFRKNRLPFVGMAATLVASVPFGAAVALLSGHPGRFGVDSMLYFWSFIGLPLIAVLLGSSAGAANANDPLRSAEEILPVSDGRAAFASAGTSALQALLLGALFLGLAFVVSAQWRESLVLVVPPSESWLRAIEAPIMRPMFWLCVGGIPLFAISSFAAAWTVRNGVAGGFLGMVAIGAMVLSLAAGLAMQLFYAYRAPFGASLIGVLFAASASTLWALGRAARWLGRREAMGWRRWAALAAAFAFGPACSALALGRSWTRVNAGISFAHLSDSEQTVLPSRPAHFSLSPEAARRVELSGAVMRGFDGGIVFVRPDGSRKPLAAAAGRTALATVLEGPAEMRDHAIWDAYGKLWISRAMPGRDGKGLVAELWRGDLESGLRHQKPLPNYWSNQMIRVGEAIGSFGWTENRYEFVRFDETGRAVAKTNYDYASAGLMLDEWFRQGYAGTVSADRASFSATLPDGTRRKWRLPGEARVDDASERERVAVRAFGRSFFAIEVADAHGEAFLALLDFDGGVRSVWRGERSAWPLQEATARGGLYSIRDGTVFAMSPEGDFLPKTPIRAVAEAVAAPGSVRPAPHRLLRVERDRLWFLLSSGRLIALRAGDGAVLSDAKLPESAMFAAMNRDYERRPLFLEERAWKAVESGLFWHTGRRLYFVEWGGAVRDLGGA
ncbi:MAG: hypothetical protein AUJ52_06705 [Elusimicrobia bacterium CG1_02_63_36]|nr:MAG: hypothetical protein AUJ52_06705 [Elusimicrobia bacterium CG1_02_63_36]PIP83322.1 MAG: hypothetical protein COR54_10170 [Elusimicrobia bacterium CG22_combo_CG10-13_8_21_14_all_63_91]PJA17975.1 MAG: hypothetical protein COX66_02865 [Elusimicrobia bacterium CG_4_10_14_0_2_um_filter_63_34]PJB26402.1 MAG: hypothetical protein CO113_03760 [Elusimicrobia bacterium CG_4_9_14_3_um_filter_62_55]